MLRLVALAILLMSVALLPRGAAEATGATTRVSVSSSGTEANENSTSPAITLDGRFVAFESFASNIVAGDTNSVSDIFLRDRQTGTTSRVTFDSAGNQTNGDSGEPALSADARFVAFSSIASDLVAGDTSYFDLFVRDRQAGTNTRVSVDSNGNQGNDGNGLGSYGPAISSDGRFVSFVSSSSNLVNGDTNGVEDIFVHDRQTGDTTSLTAHSTGNRQAGGTHGTSISADGRFVSFRSEASDLIAGDSNAHWDIFVHDRQAGVTTRVSVDSSGNQANGTSWDAVISANGRMVAFSSDASNLVPGEVFINDDIFVHDRQTGVTTRVSIHTDGTEGDAGSYEAMISADGRYVGFYSWASNLVANDIDDWTDVFVHDRSTAATTRITLDDQGDQANSYNWGAAISANGRFVAFKSEATNLVPADTNGWDDIFVRDRCADGSCATPDPDGDTFADSADNCPNWANIAQLLPAWTVAANDPDCDGFSSANETTIGTDPTRQCPGPGGTPDSWPADLVPNGTINILDVTALKPVFGQSVPPASARYDIVPSGGINILDVTALKPFFGKTCS